MNRRTWLALLLVPLRFRASKAADEPNVCKWCAIRNHIPRLNVDKGDPFPGGFIELIGDGTGDIEFILHEQTPSGYLMSDGSIKSMNHE